MFNQYLMKLYNYVFPNFHARILPRVDVTVSAWVRPGHLSSTHITLGQQASTRREFLK